MDYAPHRTICYRSLLMAVAMILLGIITMRVQVEEGDFSWNTAVRVISGVILVIAGVVMLMPRYRNIMSSIGLMCIGIGASRLMVSMSYSVAKPIFSSAMFGEFVLFSIIFGYVLMVFALYQLYRGVNFMKGNAMNAFIMRFTSMAIVIAYLVLLLFVNEFTDVDIGAFCEHRIDFVTSPILYTIYFSLLCSKEVFDSMQMERLRNNILEVAVPHNPGMLQVANSDYLDFRASYTDPDKWIKVDNDSPVERELVLKVKSADKPWEAVFRKWAGSDDIYLTLVPGKGDAYVSAIRGKVGGIRFEDEFIEVMGDEHPLLYLYPSGASDGKFPVASEPEGVRN